MTAFTGYDWLKAFHVFLSVVWVGGAVILNLLAIFALRSPLPGRKAEFAREAAWVGTRVFGPDSPEAAAQIRRVVAVARIDLVILVLAVFDMVLKPT